MKTNRRMDHLLEGTKLSNIEVSVVLQKTLRILADSGFSLIDDCVILNGLKKQSQSVNLTDFEDRTGYECFVNKFYVGDYLEKNLRPSDPLEQAIGFISILKENLRNSFDNRNFELIVSKNNKDCIARFHSIRTNESWLADDLETYQNEAILVIKV